ncbi:MAG: SEC-C metal-binding domain-containing protein [Kofleriaceae bacterium]
MGAGSAHPALLDSRVLTFYIFAMSERPGRNEPCHCGSGSKYKKCCLEKDEAARVAALATQAAAAAAAAPPLPPDARGARAKQEAPKPAAATRRMAPASRRRSV